MESSKAFSTGPEIPPGSGADSASDSATADTSTETADTSAGAASKTSSDTSPGAPAGSSSGYGPDGPLGVESVWTAPVVGQPEPTADTDPAEDEADPNDADPAESDSAASDLTGPDSAGSGSAGSFSDSWDFFHLGYDPHERVRSSCDPPALSGQLQLAPVGGLDASQVLDTLKDIDEARSWLDAQEAKVVTRALDLQTEQTRSDPRDWGYEKTVTASEIGAVLHVPDRTAGFLVEHSTLLTRYCPATLEALETGKLSRRHAWAVVEEATSIPDTHPAVTADFETRLIEMASRTTVTKFRHQANRLREQLHPESITIRHKRAVKERGVFLTSSYDGMAWLEAYLPVDQAAGIFLRVDTAARALQGPDEARTLTQLRADVLADVLTSAGTTRHMSESPEPAHSVDGEPATTSPKNHRLESNEESNHEGRPQERHAYWGVQAKVFVTVPVMTLLGGDTPGELEGYGPIDPETARKLAGHAPSFTRILTHPFTGARLGADATTYRVPKDLRDAVRVRDRTCRHPGCNRLAVFCELDHTTPWASGGKTSYGNLAALCKRHHKLKSEGYWHYRQPEPGLIIATSPAGETYVTRPDPPPAPPAEEPPPF